ncbi:ribonuclease H-like domain-containing protein [Tanacetum coccineum]
MTPLTQNYLTNQPLTPTFARLDAFVTLTPFHHINLPLVPHHLSFSGCSATCRSTSGYYVFLGDNLLTWSSKCQDTLSRSSTEAEYHGVANAVAETSWICNLLCKLHTLLFTVTLVYFDNVSAIYMSANPVQHQLTKHIEIDIHFVRDKVAAGHVTSSSCHFSISVRIYLHKRTPIPVVY